MDSVIPNWTDLRPESDAERFTERSVERRQLFEAVRDRGEDTALDPVTWAFFQVADLDCIRQLVQPASLQLLRVSRTSISDVVRLWRQKTEENPMTAGSASPAHRLRTTISGQSPSASPRPDVTPDDTSRTRSKRKHGQPEYSIGRSPTVAQSCKRRDGNLCAVSRMADIDAAHIYPWGAFGHVAPQRVEQFWDTLRCFWNPQLVQSWRDKIFVDPNEPNRGTETVANMISLTATLDRFHSAGAFALRPIRMSDDKTQLELEFHWLVREERNSTFKVDLMDEPMSSRNRLSSGNGYGPFIRTLDATSGTTLLASGTRFTMSTDDPVERPLPDPGLLTLQWHLQRVLAMSGAAGWKEEEFGDDDEDNAPGQAVAANVEHRYEDLPA